MLENQCGLRCGEAKHMLVCAFKLNGEKCLESSIGQLSRVSAQQRALQLEASAVVEGQHLGLA